MKKHAIISASLLTLLFPAVIPETTASYSTAVAATSVQQSSLTLDQVIANINKKQPIPLYLEATSSNKLINNSTENFHTITMKVWDHTVKAELRSEETLKDQQGHQEISSYASRGGKTVFYKQGDKEAVLYPAGVAAAADSRINQTKRLLERLKHELGKKTAIAFRATEEKMLGRPAYHLAKKEQLVINGKTHVYLDDLWIDKETGLLLKQVSNNNNSTQIYEFQVTKVDFKPVFSPKTFELVLPKGVKLVPPKQG